MTIKFYKFSGDEREINKDLTDELDLDGTLRDQANILTPQIGLKTDVSQYNYCYIPEFSRYYYIKEITQYRNNIWIINLKIDVLMSYKDEILNLSGIVSQLNESSYINGSGLYDVRDTHERIDWGDKLVLGSYVMVVRGE